MIELEKKSSEYKIRLSKEEKMAMSTEWLLNRGPSDITQELAGLEGVLDASPPYFSKFMVTIAAEHDTPDLHAKIAAIVRSRVEAGRKLIEYAEVKAAK